METLRRTFQQFLDLFKGMSASQRGTLVVVPVLVLGALGLLMYTNGSRSEEFLLVGKSPDELARAQDAFRKAGLTNFRATSGQGIAVPKKDVDRYMASLVVNNSLPADLAADLDRMNQSIGIFWPADQRHSMMENTRKLHISKILRAIPDVQDAVIEWDKGKQSGWSRGKANVAMMVSVRMKGGRELTPELVRSLRQIGAAALAGVSPDDVTVIDLATGLAIQPSKEGDPFNDPLIAATKQRTIEYEKKIARALEFIPGVIVNVNVELDNLKSTKTMAREFDPKTISLESISETKNHQSQQAQTRQEPGVRSNQPVSVAQTGGNTQRTDVGEETREVFRNTASVKDIETRKEGMVPKSVQVAVSIPDDYYRSIAIDRGFAPGTTDDEKSKFKKEVETIKSDVNLDVTQKVKKLIPPDSPDDAVSVSSVSSVGRKMPVAQTPIMTIALDLAGQWGGAVALGFCALWALWMINRSLARMPAEPEAPAMAAVAPGNVDSGPEEAAEEAVAAPTRRDELQAMVRDNPEMAASVLSRWLVPAK